MASEGQLTLPLVLPLLGGWEPLPTGELSRETGVCGGFTLGADGVHELFSKSEKKKEGKGSSGAALEKS